MTRGPGTLWRWTAGQRRTYLAAVLAMVVSTLLLYVVPLIVRATIDGTIGGASTSGWTARALSAMGGRQTLAAKLWIAGGSIVGLTAVSGLFIFIRMRWAAKASESIARTLRERLYDHLQHLPCSYHDGVQTGDIVQRCTSDVETVRTFYSTQVVDIARAIMLIVVGLPIMLMLDWRLALVSVVMLPPIVAFTLIFFSRVQGSFKAMDEAEGAMTAVLQENLTGIRVVRAFARQDHEKAKFAERNGRHRDLGYRLFKVMAAYWTTSDLMCLTQIALILFVGAWRASHGLTSIGTLVAFMGYVNMFLWPVRQMGRVLTELGKAMVSLTRIEEVLGQKRETAPAATAGTDGWPGGARGRIELRDVSFAHGPKAVLRGIDLVIEPGQTLAILGPSGSGKSTLINLLLRFYDYDTGSIKIDGRELRDVGRKIVRRQFATVMQEPFLYSKNLRDNIRLGRHEADDTQVIEAATMAVVHGSIEEFDRKYETLVGERGVTLSGGQRQRVAIARALLCDAPILVLDDALSAVDTHTETMIIDALRRRRGRQTTILIAHRLSTLAHADRIVVVEHGRIVQSGTHDELRSQDGLYRRLWQIQSALEEDLRSEMESTGETVATATTDN